jgi:Lon-like ATP-dependent protease
MSNENGGGGSMQMLLHGHDLIRLDKVLEVGPPLQVQVSKIRHKSHEQTDDLKAYINETMHTIREIMKINPQFREHAAMIHQGIERLERGDPHAIAHFAASLTTSSGPELMAILEAELPSEKLRLALVLLKKELELSQMQAKIASQIEETVQGKQREYMLREQMNHIKKELGEDKKDGSDALLTKFKQRLEDKTVPVDAKEAIDSEMEKFASLSKESQEFQMTRNYLDWLTMMPWGIHSKDALNLRKAREILDRDHYGLADIKDRILELIAVGALRGSVQGKIMCFVGPPGVGKTSIGRSIADALGRQFYRFSVGGLYDVAEIKGHRRTYVGSMPGKMIQCMKKVQTGNPLVLIDEVDKIGRGHQGDPASALLELLDPSQNGSFLDHYMDVPMDCSKVLFVCTANVTDTIPGPLLDRMEVIRLSGYDHQEKIKIAETYLVPNAMRESGLWPQIAEKVEAVANDSAPQAQTNITMVQPDLVAGAGTIDTQTTAGDTLAAGASENPLASSAAAPADEPAAPLATQTIDASIETSALESLIRWYCREAGVRNLQKQIEKICRKLATKAVEQNEDRAEAGEDNAAGGGGGDDAAGVGAEAGTLKMTVTEEKLSDYVGKPVFTSDRLYEDKLPVGTINGLAWTALGGCLLSVEATALLRADGGKNHTPSLTVTGQLGSVMKESSQIALLVARRETQARAPEARVKFFEERELFLHCPEGATPKDGPSAGVTMVTGLLSLALDRPVRPDLAMTGEVTLNGKVLPVGGIKEKTIAARRAGCKVLVFPQGNRRDFDELPEYLREGLEAHFADEYNDVFAVAFPIEQQEQQQQQP